MLEDFLGWSIVIVVAASLVAWAVLQRWHPYRDMFFIVFLVQGFIYLYFSPVIRFSQFSLDQKYSYIVLFLEIFICFIIPFIVIYQRRTKRIAIRPLKEELAPVNTYVVLYSLAAILLTGGFLEVAIAENLLFKRLGPMLPVAIASLSFLEFFVYRGFSEWSLFLFLLLLAIAQCELPRKLRGLVYISMSLTGLTYFAYALINSRIASVLGICAVVITYLLFTGKKIKNAAKLAKVLAVIFIVSAYSLKVVQNVRDNILYDGLTFSYLDPFYKGEDKNRNGYEFWWRLDGVELLAEMTPAAMTKGFAWGEAWIKPIEIVYLPLFDRHKSDEIKANFEDTAETYFLEHYTTIDNETMDVNSTPITDWYGNFFLMGFAACAVVIGYGFGFVVKSLSSNRAPFVFCFALFVLTRFMSFETEFITFVALLVKTLPLFLLLYLFPPFHKKAEDAGLSHDLAPQLQSA